MVCAVVDACLDVGCSRVIVVVGYREELVREALAEYGGKVEYAVQEEQLGTGHAVVCAKDAFEGRPDTDVFVLCGDGPLIRPSTLRTMLDTHRNTKADADADATIATSVIENAAGYGRIVRDADGRFEAIVEQKNATPEQLEIREINPSYYCFGSHRLFEALGKVERNELTGEYYVTDVPALMLGAGGRVEVIEAVPPEDVLSINTLEQLADVDRVFRERASAQGAGQGADQTSGQGGSR